VDDGTSAVARDTGSDGVAVGIKFGEAVDGLKVDGVLPRGPAEVAGIKGGDLLVGIGDAAVRDYDSLVPLLLQFKAGDKVTVKVRREGKYLELPLVLAKRSEVIDRVVNQPATRPTSRPATTPAAVPSTRSSAAITAAEERLAKAKEVEKRAVAEGLSSTARRRITGSTRPKFPVRDGDVERARANGSAEDLQAALRNQDNQKRRLRMNEVMYAVSQPAGRAARADVVAAESALREARGEPTAKTASQMISARREAANEITSPIQDAISFGTRDGRA
jgi:membrane-associated protease RseP (regulator of RpoE activity)